MSVHFQRQIILPIQAYRRLKFCSQKYNLTVNQIINGEATEKLRFGDHPNENFDRTKQLLVETMEFRLFACVQFLRNGQRSLPRPQLVCDGHSEMIEV